VIQVKGKLGVKLLVIIITVVMVVVILNSVKGDFRDEYWSKERMGGARITDISTAFDRAWAWIGMGLDKGIDLEKSIGDTVVSRVSNMSFCAHIIQTTPELYKHTGWAQYETVPATFIPRILWPEKPSVMDVNNEIALRYKYLAEHQVGRVALDVGLLPEAYIAFGVWGVVIAMFLFGLFIGFMVGKTGKMASGLGWNLVLVGIMCGGGLMVSWTAASYFVAYFQVNPLITP
jgi:hypothetical protein